MWGGGRLQVQGILVRKLLTLYQTKMNLTCDNFEIYLVLIGLGSKTIKTGLRNTGFVYLLDLFGKVGEGFV